MLLSTAKPGIEQINRRVLEKVTHLLLVSDQSRKGIQVVGTIKQVADELVMYDRIGRGDQPRDKPGSQQVHHDSGR